MLSEQLPITAPATNGSPFTRSFVCSRRGCESSRPRSCAATGPASSATPERRFTRRSAHRGGGSPCRSSLRFAPGGLDPARDEVAGADCNAAGSRVEEEVVTGRDDDEQHQRGVDGSEHAHELAASDDGERDTDEQRVTEVQARDGGERVVEAAEEIGAQIDLRIVRNRVDEAERGKGRGGGGEDDRRGRG